MVGAIARGSGGGHAGGSPSAATIRRSAWGPVPEPVSAASTTCRYAGGGAGDGWRGCPLRVRADRRPLPGVAGGFPPPAGRADESNVHAGSRASHDPRDNPPLPDRPGTPPGLAPADRPLDRLRELDCGGGGRAAREIQKAGDGGRRSRSPQFPARRRPPRPCASRWSYQRPRALALFSEWLARQGCVSSRCTRAADRWIEASRLRPWSAAILDALCSVDLFNEGVDLPTVDRVVMLRPTESPVVFLQQLGRGLRRAAGKEAPHGDRFRRESPRVFGPRPAAGLARPGGRVAPEFLVDGRAHGLPPGCSVDVELEAIDMLRRFLPAGATEVQRVYRELFAARGETDPRRGSFPTRLSARTIHAGARELVRVRPHGGHLTDDEGRVLERALPWLREVETTADDKSFKMVVLEVLLERDALGDGLGARRGGEPAATHTSCGCRSCSAISRASKSCRIPERPILPPGGVLAEQSHPGMDRGWQRRTALVPAGRRPARQRGADNSRRPGDARRMTRELVDYRLATYLAAAGRQRRAIPSSASCCRTSGTRSSSFRRARSDQTPGGESTSAFPTGRHGASGS